MSELNPLEILAHICDQISVEAMKVEGNLMAGEALSREECLLFVRGVRDMSQSVSTMMSAILDEINANKVPS